jgi:hypothetical protein
VDNESTGPCRSACHVDHHGEKHRNCFFHVGLPVQLDGDRWPDSRHWPMAPFGDNNYGLRFAANGGARAGKAGPAAEIRCKSTDWALPSAAGKGDGTKVSVPAKEAAPGGVETQSGQAQPTTSGAPGASSGRGNTTLI